MSHRESTAALGEAGGDLGGILGSESDGDHTDDTAVFMELFVDRGRRVESRRGIEGEVGEDFGDRFDVLAILGAGAPGSYRRAGIH